MNSKLLPVCVVLAAVLAPIPGHSENRDSDRSNPKAFVKDTVITAKIKAAFAKDQDVSMLHIKVDTDGGGAVQLSGKAKSYEEIEKAVLLAHRVEGVKVVNSSIQVTPDR